MITYTCLIKHITVLWYNGQAEKKAILQVTKKNNKADGDYSSTDYTFTYLHEGSAQKSLQCLCWSSYSNCIVFSTHQTCTFATQQMSSDVSHLYIQWHNLNQVSPNLLLGIKPNQSHLTLIIRCIREVPVFFSSAHYTHG